ncbi:helix-turn-helix domain-containing protein [Oceanobacillus halotolerans]|uniref:helix-turn-helix domain-containing protein n=1 Tax=Oceanobacillus halotolerans TaxID=2663380 RepID=UPI0013DC3AC1|nr:helix-turn-helix transcriptional regulator [Oceanobacillus halotolerans]
MKRDWLIQFRKEKRLTQEQVASKAFIDRAYYSQIETGKRNPGFNVAVNISKVLGFKPLMFFQEHLSENVSNSTILKSEISKSLRRMDQGKVIYLYNNLESYIQKVVTFVLTGMEKESFCIIIDDYRHLKQIKNSFQSLANHDYIQKHLFLIDKDTVLGCHESVENFLFIKRNNPKKIRIWIHESHENPLEGELINKVRQSKTFKKFTRNDIIYVQSYNASLLTAKAYIQMMQMYPYLMTDTAIVDSPLYDSENNGFIYPSIYIQESDKDN